MAENHTELFKALTLRGILTSDFPDFYVSGVYLIEPPTLSVTETKSVRDNYGLIMEEIHRFGCYFTTFLLQGLHECAQQCEREKQGFDLTFKCAGTSDAYIRFASNGQEKEERCGIPSFKNALTSIFKLNPTQKDGCFIKLFMDGPEKGYIFGNHGIQTMFCDDPFSRDITPAISTASFNRVYGVMAIDSITEGVKSEAMKIRVEHCIGNTKEINPKYTLLSLAKFKEKYAEPPHTTK